MTREETLAVMKLNWHGGIWTSPMLLRQDETEVASVAAVSSFRLFPNFATNSNYQNLSTAMVISILRFDSEINPISLTCLSSKCHHLLDSDRTGRR